MVYGAEAVLPCDIIHDSPRVCMYEEREAELDGRTAWTHWRRSATWQKLVPHSINSMREDIEGEKYQAANLKKLKKGTEEGDEHGVRR